VTKRAQPRDLDRRRVQQALGQSTAAQGSADRIDILSASFLGYPYKVNALTGSAETPEMFTAALDGFDCVTYIETVLALARSGNVDEFVDWLRRVRYEDGEIDWRRRNHYMTSWIRNNVRAGVLRRLAGKLPVVRKNRILNVVPGLPSRKEQFQCIPKRFVPQLAEKLRTGDLIFFGSTRSHHDIFHCGIIVRSRDRLLLRHASRSRGHVFDQELAEFLKKNRMSGLIVVRPT
jgi:cell wall-associated NlpC family hydrolase